MAAVALQPGAVFSAAPFPDDGWYSMRNWELEGNTRVTLYRRGNDVQYRLRDDHIDITETLASPNGIADLLTFLEFSMPVREGDRVRFVATQFRSAIDPAKIITQEIWAITMISQMDECTCCCNIGGHAYIQIEGVGEMHNLVVYTAEISIMQPGRRGIIPHSRARPVLKNRFRFDQEWPRSDTFLRSANRVRLMIQDIQGQVDEATAAREAGNPYPIHFNAYSPQPDQNIHNCLSWELQESEISHVRIPLIDPPLPGRGWYIPRYHIDFLDVLCKRMVKKLNPQMEEYASPRELIEIASLERWVEHWRRTRKSNSTKIIDDTVELYKKNDIISMAILTPMLVPIEIVTYITLTPVFLAMDTWHIHEAEKRLDKKKIECLKKYYTQYEGEQ